MDGEEKLRREAVRRALAGESAAAIAKELRRSRRWVVKWLARYDPREEAWARERSRAPRRVANRSAPKLEALVLSVRRRLQANPWAQVGATAILWELDKLHLRRLPGVRTVERILERAGVPRRERRARYRPKGTPYPAPVAPRPNDCQEADLIGPRHLTGAIPVVQQRGDLIACACETSPDGYRYPQGPAPPSRLVSRQGDALPTAPLPRDKGIIRGAAGTGRCSR